jgi:glucose-6-phosphate 1-epimerase
VSRLVPVVEPCVFQGLAALRLSAHDGSRAVVLLYGGHVVSWTNAQGVEQLYLSPLARFAPGQAIRGGIPVVFPQFGAHGPLPRHGFARVSAWTVREAFTDASTCRLIMRLEHTDATWRLWPFAFTCDLTVALQDNRLVVTLVVTNRGATAFGFTAALHNYLCVGAIESAQLAGLQDDVLPIATPVDRIYHDTTGTLALASQRGVLQIHQSGFPDVVVWNPGPSRTDPAPDLDAQAYREFVCVEPAVIGRAPTLAAGQYWQGTQTLCCQAAR